MSNHVLRIFSYLPNPRVWKALIAADYLGVTVQVLGDKPKNLGNWLWDFDARELGEEEKTEDSPHARVSRRGFLWRAVQNRCLHAHPALRHRASSVQSGWCGGRIRIQQYFASGCAIGTGCKGLYGRNAMDASRIDSFLDATLVFGREAQVYLLGIDGISQELHGRMAAAFEFYLEGIERALEHSAYIAGDQVTIADIAFACDVSQFLRERLMRSGLAAASLPVISENAETTFPRAFEHLSALIEEPEFIRYFDDYTKHFRV